MLQTVTAGKKTSERGTVVEWMVVTTVLNKWDPDYFECRIRISERMGRTRQRIQFADPDPNQINDDKIVLK